MTKLTPEQVEKLEAAAKLVPAGPYRQGETLFTRQTAHWSKEQVTANNAHERLMVFANFYPSDEGRSRFLIAQTQEQDIAEYIANCDPDTILTLCREWREMHEALDYLDQECLTLKCESYPNADAGDYSIQWEVVEYHATPPRERIIAASDTPLRAIEHAMRGDIAADDAAIEAALKGADHDSH